MAIILKCAHDHGSAAFPAEEIEGLPVGERHYLIINGEITLSGHTDAILHHDAAELLAVPGGLYRMPTPAEQDAKAEAARQAATVEEVLVKKIRGG